jgi:hypothetical protein
LGECAWSCRCGVLDDVHTRVDLGAYGVFFAKHILGVYISSLNKSELRAFCIAP